MKNHRQPEASRNAPLQPKAKGTDNQQAPPEDHPIFLRAYIVAVNRKGRRGRKTQDANLPKWPGEAIIIDTESRVTADQRLTFGVYRLCKLVDNNYKLTEEGVFWADDLADHELKILENHIRAATPDVPSFPPKFPHYTRSQFIKRVFWPYIKQKGALVCGFNLPFDLARLALAWDRGDKDEWSLTMSQYPDGAENKNYPRLLITPIDSKKAFIRLANPWKRGEWKNDGDAHFLDLRTLGWALFNKSFSLKTACEELKTEHQKTEDHEPSGKVTPEEIEYARQDGRCTLDLLNALKREFDKHPIALRPYDAYSPASVAKSYLDTMGIVKPAEKFEISNEVFGIAMQSYYGGRSETRIRHAEVPVVPLDFTSEYPSVCALLGLFDVLTAEKLKFEDDTRNVVKFLKSITLDRCFNPALWAQCRFFALVKPNDDILPVRTVYNEVTQNIGNNYLTSDRPLWFSGPDLIASMIRTDRRPHVVRAIRMIPKGKQIGMKPIELRGMVQVDPYRDDLFRRIIEQRKLHKSDKALYYWLKILANSIYGFFVELIPENVSKEVAINVFSGEKKIQDYSDALEKEGRWFFPPLASLITSGGRLLLAMAEKLVDKKRGTYLFCDTDSLAVVAAKQRGPLQIPGRGPKRILSWAEVDEIADRFTALNPYNHKLVKGSILNLVDANYVNPDTKDDRRQLYGYSIAAKRYALYEKIGSKDIKILDPKAHGIGFLYPPKDSPKDWDNDVPKWIFEMWDYIIRGVKKLKYKVPAWLNLPQMMRLTVTTYNVLKMLEDWGVARPYNFLFLPMVDPAFGYAFLREKNEKVLLVAPFSSKQQHWFSLKCLNIHTGKQYRMVDPTKEKNPPYNVVFPSQFARLLVEYQEHPESKSLAPDGSKCGPHTSGLLQRAHIVAGEFRYVGKETDRKWEEGDNISLLEFKTTEYGRAKRVIASDEVRNEITTIGIKECARESGFDRKNFVRKLVRGLPVKRNSYEAFVRWLETYKSKSTNLAFQVQPG
ncbi:MAG: hypothetical protein ACYDCM_13130 [Candidatus Acidiferrales bacterium]